MGLRGIITSVLRVYRRITKAYTRFRLQSEVPIQVSILLHRIIFNGKDYEFWKTLSFKRAQKTIKKIINHTLIRSSDR